jgi:hypothetical protein
MVCQISTPPQATADWNAVFTKMLPTILYNLRFEFRKLDDERREEAIAESVANAFTAFCRLVRRGRGELAYPTVLARFAASQVRAGRSLGSRLNANDVSSRYCQQRRGLRLQSLDQYDRELQEWKEAVVEDPRTPVLQQVWFRIDFPAWLKRLSTRNRKIALALAKGFTTSWVAKKFRLSAARISQLRRELCDSWHAFHAGLDRAELPLAAG